MSGVQGLELDAGERELLQHPLLCGVILFSRNYHSPQQLLALTTAIHKLREPPLLIAVDHEGGRVQRFRENFTTLPPLRRFGEIYPANPLSARQLAHTSGWLMAAELRAVVVDFSFAPVLDRDLGISAAIGNRAFHAQPQVISELARAYLGGMRKAGMNGVGKHFPGHGSVTADSHLELPVDKRDYADIAAADLIPFKYMIDEGIGGIMPAHVVYAGVDPQPAGFSAYWLKTVLRQTLGFTGVVFSDDLGMAAAGTAGGPLARAEAALQAGCDVLLSCNEPSATAAILDGLDLQGFNAQLPRQRLQQLVTRTACPALTELHADPLWQQSRQLLEACRC
jgi:beta-N-acetylhexosaminidase